MEVLTFSLNKDLNVVFVVWQISFKNGLRVPFVLLDTSIKLKIYKEKENLTSFVIHYRTKGIFIVDTDNCV